MYKYEICFKSGVKIEFESFLNPSEIVKKLAPIVGRSGEIYLLPDDELINCSEIVYVREVKQ